MPDRGRIDDGLLDFKIEFGAPARGAEHLQPGTEEGQQAGGHLEPVAVSDGAEVGNITTVATPAITTFQDGSVSAAGITYAHGTNPIYVTVNDAGTLKTLTTSNTKLYTVPAGTTEADLVLASIAKTNATGLTILDAAEEVKGINFAANTTAKFTPAAAGTYAIEFTDGSDVKYYKVIIVA